MSINKYSWGGYPPLPQELHNCFWRDEIVGHLRELTQDDNTTLPYGNGRSYGDSCLAASGKLLGLRGLNRFIHADWEKGILFAECGVTLGEILQRVVPHGWFLNVTPGTQFVSLGGAIANDVHGKNHHRRGTFGCHVRSFGLVRSDQSEVVCSPLENKELFEATIGGLGLTGVIAWAEIQLQPIKSNKIDEMVVRFANLTEFFALSDELDLQHEYTVAWIDCLAQGDAVGRGVYMVGDHAEEGELKFPQRHKWTVPLTPPFSLINRLSLKMFNEAYYRIHPQQRTHKKILFDGFFYPLDAVLHWNRVYGRVGFQQYQCVIPPTNAEAAVRELLSAIAAARQGSFLAVLKRCGDIASPGLLSFPMPGTTLALDFPQSRALTTTLFPRLDAIVREAGGRMFPAKDAHMSAADFQRFYPNWGELEKLRDPHLASAFWKRVTS